MTTILTFHEDTSRITLEDSYARNGHNEVCDDISDKHRNALQTPTVRRPTVATISAPVIKIESEYGHADRLFKHLVHSHLELIARSLMNEPFQGTLVHFPFSFIRMTLLAMHTGVYIRYINFNQTTHTRMQKLQHPV